MRLEICETVCVVRMDGVTTSFKLDKGAKVTVVTQSKSGKNQRGNYVGQKKDNFRYLEHFQPT